MPLHGCWLQRKSMFAPLSSSVVGVTALTAVTVGRPVRSWLREERLNDMVAAFLQYFGVIYGLLLGLLALATYQNRLEVE
jgi:hypothetical protein